MTRSSIRLDPMIPVALALALAAFAAPARADLAAAAAQYKQVCASCHGADGNTPIDPSYPKIAKQYPDYIHQALKDYKSGARKNAIMGAIAQNLTSQEMKDLSGYIANLDGSLKVSTGGHHLRRAK